MTMKYALLLRVARLRARLRAMRMRYVVATNVATRYAAMLRSLVGGATRMLLYEYRRDVAPRTRSGAMASTHAACAPLCALPRRRCCLRA